MAEEESTAVAVEAEPAPADRDSGEEATTHEQQAETANQQAADEGGASSDDKVDEDDTLKSLKQQQISEPSEEKEDGRNETANKDQNGDAAEGEQHAKWIEQYKACGADAALTKEIVKLFDSGVMSEEDVDDRVVEMLSSLRVDQATYILQQVEEANLIGVQHKASFMMAVIKNFKDRLNTVGPQAAISQQLLRTPDKTALQEIVDRTGSPMEVTIGQRKYGPPPGVEKTKGSRGTEIYVGNIPNELFEDALIPLFEEVGQIYDLRLMMEPMTGHNKGYCFLSYTEADHAKAAAKKFDGFEIKKGKKLRVNVSVANTRLFIGNIPKAKSKDEIVEDLKEVSDAVTQVLLYTSPEQELSRRNRGFCFVDFASHKDASDFRRKLNQGKVRLWNLDVVVDWAEAQEEPDEDTMAKVKILYVRNLKEDVTEEDLKMAFEKYGELDHVKKIKDYCFVHYLDRESALKGLEAMNGAELGGAKVEVSLARPQTDKLKKERQKLERQRQELQMMFGMGRARGRGRGDFGGGMRGMRGGGGGFFRGGGGYMRGRPTPSPYTYGPGGAYRGGYGGDSYGGGYYGGGGYESYGYGGGGGGYEPYGYGGGGYEQSSSFFDDAYGYDPYAGGYEASGGYGPPPPPRRPMGFRGVRSGGRAGMPMGAGRGAKRPSDSGGGPQSKRPNYDDYSADINMSAF